MVTGRHQLIAPIQQALNWYCSLGVTYNFLRPQPEVVVVVAWAVTFDLNYDWLRAQVRTATPVLPEHPW